MIFTGKQILESQELKDFLHNCDSKVTMIEWADGSITDGSRREMYIQYISEYDGPNEDKKLYIVDGLWSEAIRENMTLNIETPDTDLYNVFNTTEAAILWGKDESTIRKAIQNGKFEQWSDYRKSGRITLITRRAMERVYGKLN